MSGRGSCSWTIAKKGGGGETRLRSHGEVVCQHHATPRPSPRSLLPRASSLAPRSTLPNQPRTELVFQMPHTVVAAFFYGILQLQKEALGRA